MTDHVMLRSPRHGEQARRQVARRAGTVSCPPDLLFRTLAASPFHLSAEHKDVFIKVVIDGNITIVGSTRNGLTEKLEVGNFTFDPLDGSHRLGAGDRFFMRGGSKYEWEDAEIAFIYIPTNGLLAQKYV